MKRLIVLAAVLALALASVAWAKVSIKVVPPSVRAGKVVTVFGSAGAGCANGKRVTLLSKAFPKKHEFAGVPAIYARTGKGGAFSVKATIPKSRTAAKYTITGRCGGGNLGVSASLKVFK